MPTEYRFMVKLKDLAQELNLSITTVSRGLNGFSDVNTETRNRIIAAAQRLGYRPNMNARRLVTGRSNSIGLANPSGGTLINEAHIAEFLSGIGETLAESEYDLLLIPFREGELIDRYRRAIASNRVDSIIVTGILAEDERIAFLTSQNIPFVVHGRTFTDIPYAFIDIDNFDVSFRSAQVLIDHGHRRIGLINGPLDMTFSHQRLDGYKAALAAADIPFDPTLVTNGMMSDSQGFDATMAFLDLSDPTTAIVAGSMTNGIGVYRAARSRGLTIGKDLSLIAHDDVFHFLKPEAMIPPLTTTMSSMRDAGRMAAELSIRQLAGEPIENLQVIWKAELIARQSVGPVPSA